MKHDPPAAVGQREDEVDTPALLVDLDALEQNLDQMARLAKRGGVALRPHAKAHKSHDIARLQIDRGAAGVCVQKVAEAEALIANGVPGILVSNEVAGTPKLARFAHLARTANVAICADSEPHVAALEAAAADANVRFPVFVEIDAGQHRCGTDPGERAALLARSIKRSQHLTFGGIQAYHGSAQHLRRAEQRSAAIAAANAVRVTLEALARLGIPCPAVTGGGTGTFEYEIASGLYTEIQPGSYCFMDADYARNLDASGAPVSLFRQSLFVLATVMSAPRRGVAVLDAGHKAVAIESGLPLVLNRPDIVYTDASDEHGTLTFVAAAPAVPQFGQKLRLVPGHCDPTVDRHDWYVGIRDGVVEHVWEVTARGAMR